MICPLCSYNMGAVARPATRCWGCGALLYPEKTLKTRLGVDVIDVTDPLPDSCDWHDPVPETVGLICNGPRCRARRQALADMA